MPSIIKALDLSTEHLDMADRLTLERIAATDGDPYTIATPDGWFMFAPQPGSRVLQTLTRGLAHIATHARIHECSYIMFSLSAPMDLQLMMLQAQLAAEEM